MNADAVVGFGRQALEMMLIVSAPVLIVALVIGLSVSLLQAITQINEATLSFLPKLMAVGVTLVVFGPWMLTMLTDYLQRVITGIGQQAGG